MNLKRRAHFAEETYKQWAMIRALAFAERDWIFCCTIIFLLNKTFVFLSLPGLVAFFLGLFFVGPIVGMCLHATQLYFYKRRKESGAALDQKFLQRMTWKANAIWLPVMALLAYGTIDLFYQMQAEVLSAAGLIKQK
jgi:hypothetical protein